MGSMCGARRGCLGRDDDVDVVEPPTLARDAGHDVGEQAHRIGVAERVVGRGEQRAEVGEPGRPEQRIGDRVRRRRRRRSGPPRRDAPAMRTPAEHERRLVAERVHVEAEPDPVPHVPCLVEQGLREREVVGTRELQIAALALDDHNGAAGGLDEGGVVGIDAADPVRGAQDVGPERLRGLNADEILARHGLDDRGRRRRASPCRRPEAPAPRRQLLR